MDYLHNHCQTPLVHCDLKPSNILLDDELVAMLVTSGWLKFLQQKTGVLQKKKQALLVLRGTVGYTTPEYGMGNEVTTHGDVYSLGILLLEMFTGKRPTDEMFKGSLNLHRMVTSVLPDHVTQVTDSLLGSRDLEPYDKYEN